MNINKLLGHMETFVTADIQLRVDLGVTDVEVYEKIEKAHRDIEDEAGEPIHITGDQLAKLYDFIIVNLEKTGYGINLETSHVYKISEEELELL